MVAKATKLGATVTVPVADMFWGDRSGTVVDPEGHTWMIATHQADLTTREMTKKMKDMIAQTQSAASAQSA